MMLAADAVSAAALAADAGTEIASAVWGSGSRTLTSSFDPTAATIADAVWDEARSGHVAAGSFGEGVVTNSLANGAVTAAAIATNAIDADALAADAVTEIQSGLATSAALTTVAGYVDTEVAAVLAAVDTEVAAIKAKTDNLPASPAAVGSAMTLAADAVNATSLASSAVAEMQSGLSTLTAGQVNAEMLDVLTTDTFAEPSGVPAATSSLKDKIAFIFAALRNKRLTTATTDTIRNDADSADIAAATLNENGTTFTRGEYA
jgi:hypothetical protein